MSGQPKSFSGAEFDLVMGAVYGVRAWQMDDAGYLRALHVPAAEPWRPGVNVAACHQADLMAGSAGCVRAAISAWQTAIFGFAEAVVGVEESSHDVPVEACFCGLYAYTDLNHREDRANGTNQWVLGVVKGTGRALIGTRGFRCQKAEIVALLDPTRGGVRLLDWQREQRENLRRVYPDVPMVADRDELLAAAPIDRLQESDR